MSDDRPDLRLARSPRREAAVRWLTYAVLAVMFWLSVALRFWILVGPMNPDRAPDDPAAAAQAGWRWVRTGYQTPELCFSKPDTGHYLQMAFAMVHGDFTFSTIRDNPHRTILLSVLLAPVLALFGPGIMPLKLANAVLGAAVVFPMYLLGRELVDRRVGLVAPALSVTLHFYLRHSLVLYTEALYVPLYVTALWLMFRALQGRAPFWTIGVAAGLAYLTRASGLLLAGAIGVVVLLHVLRQRQWRAWLSLGAYGLAFALAASPLALIKAMHGYGPLHHGANNANLWAESFHDLHYRLDRCTPARWLARHHLDHSAYPPAGLNPDGFSWDQRLPWTVEVPRRFGYGVVHSFWDNTPGEYGHLPNLLGLLGLVLVVAYSRAWALWLVFLLQGLPLWWAVQANPAERLVWGTIGPLLTLAAALTLVRLWDLGRDRHVGAGLLASAAWGLLLVGEGEGFVPDVVHWVVPLAALGAVIVSRQLDAARRRLPWLVVPVMAVAAYLAYYRLVWPGVDWHAKRLVLLAGLAAVGGIAACLPRFRDRLRQLRVAPVLTLVLLLALVTVTVREAVLKTVAKVEDYRATLARMELRADDAVPQHPLNAGRPLPPSHGRGW